MKRKTQILSLALFLFSFTAMAQVKFSVGIKAGPNFASLNVKDPNASYQNRTGWHGGAFMLLKFAKVGIQPEVLFSQQGATVKINSGSYESNFSYINIPIIIKLYTVLGINLQVGPQFGFLTNDPVLKDAQSGERINNAYKSSDMSAAMGVGWDLPLGITIDARYNLGLSKVNTSSANTTQNQVWQVSLGYKLINIGKK